MTPDGDRAATGNDRDRLELRRILEDLISGSIDIEVAASRLAGAKSDDIGFARLDPDRADRTSLPEIVYAPGKSTEQLLQILNRMRETAGLGIASRVSSELARTLASSLPDGDWFPEARIFALGDPRDPIPEEGSVAVITAGTSDIPVAEEACVLMELLGIGVDRFFDVGVAGMHRLATVIPEIRQCTVCVVVAGMDAALPSVVGGLFRGPVIGVPTSTGYGTSFGGVSALLAILNSCSPGVVGVNIDNGVGAAAAAIRSLRSGPPGGGGAAV